MMISKDNEVQSCDLTLLGRGPNRVKSQTAGYFLRLSFFLLVTSAISLVYAATRPSLAPYAPKYPGTYKFESPGEGTPDLARNFLPYRDSLAISWDDSYLYIETNGLPAHGMMQGITSWQQQLPIAHDYTGSNAFRLPLHPKYLEKPGELTLQGPLAIAVNGIPIFHALTQSGKDAYAGGELDQWGGHCGRADDYHYHIAPVHLQEKVGPGKPIAFALDGYPIYAADPSKDGELDECHGYFDKAGNYRYVGELRPPYVLGAFRGEADLENRPRAGGIRPFLRPLRGAAITGFSGSLKDGFDLRYKIGDSEAAIHYSIQEDGGVQFRFRDPDGSIREESYEKRPPKEFGPGKGKKGKGDKPRPKGKPKRKEN